jgi:2-C-methyl-D-erythritol 4-phosphate cytidylyltransferase
MVDWSIEAMRDAPSVRSIVVACPPGHIHDLGGHDLGVVAGGATRAESVANALEAVGTELVAVHDAARPLLTSELIEGVVATLLANPEADGAIAATPVTDTIKLVAATEAAAARRPAETPSRTRSGDRVMTCDPYRVINSSTVVEETLDRGRLWAAQTPQVFRTAALREALAAWLERAAADPERTREATDEAMLVEVAGGKVLVHPSSPENLKVTTPTDLKLAELLLGERSAQ